MLTYKRSEQLEVVGYSNSDYGGCLDSLKSTSGFVFVSPRIPLVEILMITNQGY